MTSEQAGTQEAKSEFDMSSCMAMMEKLMSEHWESCDCAEMMSQISSQEGIPDEWMSVMNQMMESHIGNEEEEGK